MKKQVVVLFLLIILVGFSSCKRELGTPNTGPVATAVEDLKIPINFNWDASQNIEIIVNIQSTKAYEPKSKISVFNGDPANGGSLIISGAASAGNSFQGTVSIPPYIEEVYLICEGPFGEVKTEKTPIVSGLVNYTFSNTKRDDTFPPNFYKNTADGPNCDEGCDQYISGGGTVNIGGGLTYCINTNFSGKINFENWNGGATLRICGTASINNNQYLESNSHIIIAEGGILNTNKDFQFAGGSITIYQNATVDLDDIDMGDNAVFIVYENASVEAKSIDGYGINGSLINYGSLSIDESSYHMSPVENYGTLVYKKVVEFDGSSLLNNGSFEAKNKFYAYSSGTTIDNYGDFQVTKDMEIGNNTIFTNFGTLTAKDGFKVYNNASVINNGSITVSDDCDISTSGDFTNNCNFTGLASMDFSSGVKITLNTGYLKIGQEINFYNDESIDLNSNCMILAEDMVMQCDMNGSGGLSSVIVIGDLDVRSNNDSFDGAIEVSTMSGEMHSGGAANFTNGAYLTSLDEAVNYLPITACNPDGFGTPTITDMDFDGVPDLIDDYPNDPLRAFDSYFPDNQQFATLAFEDLWPSQGDYDFNDLVVAIFGSQVTNADDQLVDIRINFVVLAVGASLDNGLAFQLETLTPGMIQSASGMILEQGYTNIAENGLEEDQSKAVIIVTESINDIIHRPGGSFFNTIPENPQGTSDTVSILITLTEPVDPQLFGFATFNPFIIKNKQRNVEIHLPNFPPTNLMDEDLFGTSDDASNPVAGIYYVTTTNLPWGMLLIEPFDYPVEKAQVIHAYNHFGSWAESGGSIYTDWYLGFPGYRNNSNIY